MTQKTVSKLSNVFSCLSLYPGVSRN